MRYVVVHSHFYQPPRENPWTEVIERQPTAAPYHDWNERIADECYERLGAAGVHGPDGRIVALVNLFGRMSFNVGPTLAAWLERFRPDVLTDARAGYEEARARTGSGPALMQPYGHPIMPLCDEREKALQLAWGADDFEHRFGEKPKGLWFPETAMDMASLVAAHDAGLRFTVVAPEQVRRVRPPEGAWRDVGGARVPPHRPYLVRLPGDRTMTIFVFDGEVSRGAAFGGTLSSGSRLLESFRAALDGAPAGEDALVLLASDGETFGHHQRGAEAALAEGLVRARMTGVGHVTHLGELVERFPARWEAELHEPSAWSCAHGVGRWERDCGCGVDAPGWDHTWRTPLRRAARALRDRVFALVDRRGPQILKDPWEAARAAGPLFVRLPSPEETDDFLTPRLANGSKDPSRAEAQQLIELIRQVLFSSTSCGWFFDDISGIETIQVMRHMARASELCARIFDVDPKPALVDILRDAKSNVRGAGDGARVFALHGESALRTPGCAIARHGVLRFGELVELAEGDTAPSGATPPIEGRPSAHQEIRAYVPSEAGARGAAAQKEEGGRAAALEARGEGERSEDPIEDAPPVAPVATVWGAYAVSESVAPTFRRDGEGRYVVEGRAIARHLRTRERREAAFSLVEQPTNHQLLLEVDGEAGEELCLPAQAAIVELCSRRAAARIPSLDPAIVDASAWIGRAAAEIGMPLPSPLDEALRSAGRALVARALRPEALGAVERAQLLRDVLTRARDIGLGPPDLKDMLPRLGAALSGAVQGVLAMDDERDPERYRESMALIVATTGLAREVAGEDALSRLRRRLARLPDRREDEAVLALAEAAGMTRDALSPVDVPVRGPDEDRHDSLA